MVDGAGDIDSSWVLSAKTVGVTAGASAPEVLVKDVIAKLTDLGGVVQGEMRPADEGISFSLPVELRESEGRVIKARSGLSGRKTNGIKNYRRSVCGWRRPLDGENGNAAQVHLCVHDWMADNLVSGLSDDRTNHYRSGRLKGRIPFW